MIPSTGKRPPATPLCAALMHPDCYPHPVTRIRVTETHISRILLTGELAYKIKKPVDLGFADFTTLARRRRYCEAELRLNRRLAPKLYLDVVAIRAGKAGPRVGARRGRIIDYAVRMRQFPQRDLASRALKTGRFGAREIDALAALIAAFHKAAPAALAGGFGSPAAVLSAARDNFKTLLALDPSRDDRKRIERLRNWTERTNAAARATIAARKAGGKVRECHGDLHLGNIVLLDGKPVPFDCIEFNEDFRRIDVTSEIAFLAMDLVDRGRDDLAWRFVNRYFEETGDYGGLNVLRSYLVYRALVRAKVHLIRARQAKNEPGARTRLLRAFRGYLRLADRFASPGRVALILAHGLSGSGKTTATQSLVETIGAVRVRSDVERKRLHGLAPLESSRSTPGAGIYSRSASAAVYRHLGEIAQNVLRAGYPTIVDATFLRRDEREAFRAIAEACDAPFAILDFHASLATLRARVVARSRLGDDASEAGLAVLERQIALREPLTPAEMAVRVIVNGTRVATAETWKPLVRRLRLAF